MKSSVFKAFLSASFEKEDIEVVKYFQSICEGLGIECVNVDTAYVVTPPEKARELIKESDALVAVATKRVERKNGKFNMPSAVDEEMSMAFGLGKPILIFVEDGIDVDKGFIKNYGTYKQFTRDKLSEHSVFREIISAIEELKTKIFLSHEPKLELLAMGEYYVEISHMLISLEKENDQFIWDYSNSKKVIFTSAMKQPFKAGAWPCVHSKNIQEADLLKWDCKVASGSKEFKLLPKIDKLTPDSVELRLNIEPTPQADDYMTYDLHYRSKYLNPIYVDQVKSEGPFVILDSNEYLCGDGVVPIRSTKRLKVQFRFPKEYGLVGSNFAPFVGSVTTRVDFVVASEIERMKFDIDDFGGNIVIDFEIENPLLNYMYGICWNPPENKAN